MPDTNLLIILSTSPEDIPCGSLVVRDGYNLFYLDLLEENEVEPVIKTAFSLVEDYHGLVTTEVFHGRIYTNISDSTTGPRNP